MKGKKGEKGKPGNRDDFGRLIRVGLEQIRRGETIEPDEVWAEIKSMSRAARAAVKNSQ